MASVALATLLRAKPDGPFRQGAWLESALERCWCDYQAQPDDRVRCWSVGTVIGNETLVQARPVVRDPHASFLDDFLRTAAPCNIAAFASADSDAEPLPRIGLLRFQRWIAATSEPELGADEGIRRALRAELPGFLLRSQVERTDRELVFFSFLAALHNRGALGSAYANPSQILLGLRDLDDRLGHTSVQNLMISDGRTLGVRHRGATLLALRPPPNPERRAGMRFATETDRRPAATASLLVLDHAPPSDTGDAEPIAEGVFAVAPIRPHTIQRA